MQKKRKAQKSKSKVQKSTTNQSTSQKLTKVQEKHERKGKKGNHTRNRNKMEKEKSHVR